MSEIYVDSFFFACPPPGSNAVAYTAYVARLADLQLTNSCECLTFLVPASTLETLEQANALPPWEKSEIDLYVQREEVSKLLFGLLGKLQTIEDQLQIKELLVDEVSCLPLKHLSGRTAVQIEDYHRTAAFLCLQRHLQQDLSEGGILTAGLTTHSAVTVFGKIIEAEVAPSGPPVVVPIAYREVIDHFPGLTELSRSLSPINFWQGRNFAESINLAVFQRKGDPEELWPNVSYPYSILEPFLRSVEHTGFVTDRTRIQMLLRACVSTILDEDLRDSHALRVSQGANSKQRTRQGDGATAWRRDVDHEHHLHYWKIGSEIQFASVVPHNDFDIPE